MIIPGLFNAHVYHITASPDRKQSLCQRWVMFGCWQYVINCWRADIGPTLKPQQLKCCTLLAKRWRPCSTTTHNYTPTVDFEWWCQ